jgi:hypothetical protein
MLLVAGEVQCMVVIAVLGCLVTVSDVLGDVIVGHIDVMLNLRLVWEQDVVDLNMGGIDLLLCSVDLSSVCGTLGLTVCLVSRVLLIRLILSKVELINDLIKEFNDLLNGSTSGQLEVNSVK